MTLKGMSNPYWYNPVREVDMATAASRVITWIMKMRFLDRKSSEMEGRHGDEEEICIPWLDTNDRNLMGQTRNMFPGSGFGRWGDC